MPSFQVKDKISIKVVRIFMIPTPEKKSVTATIEVMAIFVLGCTGYAACGLLLQYGLIEGMMASFRGCEKLTLGLRIRS